MNATIGRNESYYFQACNMLWAWIVQSGMKNRKLWNLRKALFSMGADFALSLEQYEWVCQRVEECK